MIEFDNFFSNWNIFYHSQDQRFYPGKNKSDYWHFILLTRLDLNLAITRKCQL